MFCVDHVLLLGGLVLWSCRLLCALPDRTLDFIVSYRAGRFIAG